MNPGGSIKDRSSLGMIKSALESGDLKPKGPVLEGKISYIKVSLLSNL